MTTATEIEILDYDDFAARIQALASDFVSHYSDATHPLFPWHFVIRPDSRFFDNHVHLCVFQALQGSPEYAALNTMQDFESVQWYADVDNDNLDMKELYENYTEEFATL